MPQSPYSTILAVLAAFIGAAVAVRVAHSVVQRWLRGMETTVGPENHAALRARAGHLKRAVALLGYAVAAVASVSLALSRFGLGEPMWDARVLARWAVAHAVNVIIIIVGSYVMVRAANFIVEHLQFRLGRRHAPGDLEWQRRTATLGGILRSLVTASVGFVAILMLLRELSIDVLPILTGAGIAGLAIGFGAQNLVRDVISGFFMILEDQVRVGDLARINGVAGIVEQVNLRTVVLRDAEGAVQVFPNGSVTTLANLSKRFAYAIVDIRIAYTEDLDRAIAAIREVGAAMESDRAWGPLVLAPVEVLGVESFGDLFVTIRARYKTAPLNQGKVASELRGRLMTGFAIRGIRPYARP